MRDFGKRENWRPGRSCFHSGSVNEARAAALCRTGPQRLGAVDGSVGFVRNSTVGNSIKGGLEYPDGNKGEDREVGNGGVGEFFRQGI